MSDKIETPKFEVSYVSGPSFRRSYFVATDGKSVSVVRASRVIPVDVQKHIIASVETDKKDPQDVTPLEEVCEQIKTASKDLAGFKVWAEALPLETEEGQDAAGKEPLVEPVAVPEVVAAATGTEKKAMLGENAVNESEIPKTKVDIKKAEMAQNEKEAEAGKKDTKPTGSGLSSPVSKYFNRLPSKSTVSTPATVAINLKSNLDDQYGLLVQAVEEEKIKRQALEADLLKMKEEKGAADDKVKGLEKEKKDGEVSKQVTAVVSALVTKGLIDEAKRTQVIEILKKIDDKALVSVSELLALVGGKPAMPKPPMPAMPMPGKEPLDIPKAAAQDLPAIFKDEAAPSVDSATSRLSGIWNR